MMSGRPLDAYAATKRYSRSELKRPIFAALCLRIIRTRSKRIWRVYVQEVIKLANIYPRG